MGRSWLVLTLLTACSHGATAEGADEGVEAGQQPSDPAKSIAPVPEEATGSEGLLIGTYRQAREPVVDGDTIRVEGIEGSIRLLSIDTEEPFRRKADRLAAADDFERYLKRKRGGAPRPRKAGTPLGEEASAFARSFFDGATFVRLERDDPRQGQGRYGRQLAHAFVQRNGAWTHYNVECVRAGMSPYFTKYGYSDRFHETLSLAEAQAKRARRGIWNPNAQGYRDYPERKAWWNARADFIREFERDADGQDDRIQLSHADAAGALERNLGKEVTVLSTVEAIRTFKGLVRVSLAFRPDRGFPIIFFDKRAFAQSGIAGYQREPVTVRGRIDRYEKGSYRALQIVVDDPDQIAVPALPPPR